jgi:PAS domain S-box-containing protein
MKSKLRILIVEDIPSDIKLIKQEIKNSEIKFVDKVVETKEDYIEAFQEFKPDIILSNYSLSHFSGIQALEIRQKEAPLVPFILVTDSLNEETAVEIMKSGADDYIIKQHLTRLGSAIKSALNKKGAIESKRQTEEELLKSRELYQSIFENTGTVTVLVDENTTIIDVNEECQSITGYTKEQLIGSSWKKYVAPDFMEIMKKYNELRFQNYKNVPTRYEADFINPNGEIRSFILSLKIIPLTSILVVSMLDITERKRAEESLKKREAQLSDALSIAHLGPWEYDVINDIFTFNDAFYSIFKTTAEKVGGYEMSSAEYAKRFVFPEDAELVGVETRKAIEADNPYFSRQLEHRMIYDNGEIGFITVRFFIVKDKDKRTIKTYGVNQDITERKRAEDSIKESENKFNNVFKYSPVAISITTVSSGKIIDVNKTFLKNTGYSRDELIGKTIFELNLYGYLPERDKLLTIIKNKGYLNNYEINFRKKSGEVLNCLLSFVTILLGGELCILSNIIDITERKKVEKALFEAEERFRTAFENTVIGLYRTTPDGQIILANPSLINMLGYSSFSELVNRNLEESGFNPDYPRSAFKEQIEKEDKVVGSESRWIKSDGSVIYIRESARAVRDEKGNIIFYEGSVEDITERKQAEESLRESEVRFQLVARATGNVIYDWDMVTGEGWLSESYRKLFGYDETKVKFDLWKKNIHPEDREKILSYTDSIIFGSGETWTCDYRFRRADGSYAYIIDCGYILRDEKGKPIRIIGTMMDFTDRKKVEEALKESDERFKQVTESSGVLVWEVNVEGLYTYVSSMEESILGYEPKDVIGKKHFYEFFPPDKEAELTKAAFETFSNKETFRNFINPNIHKDGHLVILETSGTPMLDKKGNLIGYRGTDRDITNRKITEDALQESEEKYRILIQTMNDGVIQSDKNDVIQFVNKSTCDMFGYKQEELIGKIVFDIIIYEPDREIIMEKNRLRLLGHTGRYEIRGKKKSGEIIWLSINGSPITDKEGNVTGSVGILSDITERKYAEEELRKLSRAVEQSPASIIITDLKGNIEYVNPKFIEITGYRLEETIGRNPRMLKSGETPSEEYKKLWDIINSGEKWRGEFHNKKKNGELFWESASISPIRSTDGKITHFLAVKEDITEKKQKEIELMEAKEKAEEMNKLKSNFLANMSHELRTPMVGIMGFSEILSNEIQDNELKNMAESINVSGKRLLDTLNSILNLSRIEANKKDFKLEMVNISKVLNEFVILYRAAALQKGLYLKFNSKVGEVFCDLDIKMFHSILDNLLNNAIKFTLKGGVEVVVDRMLINENDYCIIKIIDTGIGIESNNTKLIFEEFRQVSEGLSRSFEGTGLGLSITKKFVELMYGIITVESNLGKGSTFSVIFPASNHRNRNIEGIIDGNKKEKVIAIEEKISNPTVLLVDDDKSTFHLIDLMLVGFCDLDYAGNSKDALELIQQKKYDLILLDINLGKGPTGIKVLEEIRKCPNYENIPVVAFTAYAMDGDKERLLNAGFNYYLSKPFEKKKLINLLEKIFQK